jgi:hypothetical protein
MNNKEAIKIAKEYVLDVFGDEGIEDIGLEEITRDGSRWLITIGFSRKWQKPSAMAVTMHNAIPKRSYKELWVDPETNSVLSVKEADWAKS